MDKEAIIETVEAVAGWQREFPHRHSPVFMRLSPEESSGSLRDMIEIDDSVREPGKLAVITPAVTTPGGLIYVTLEELPSLVQTFTAECNRIRGRRAS
jgi:hypothetical protein